MKIYDLPMGMRSQKYIEIVGKIWKFVQVDPMDLRVPYKAKVDCDLEKALRTGMLLKKNVVPTWFKMKYIKLLDFYYACSLLAHIYHHCTSCNSSIHEGGYIKGLRVGHLW